MTYCHLQMVDAFHRYLATEKRASALTVEGYLRDLGFFTSWVREVEGQFDAATVEPQTLRRYLRHLYDHRLAPATIARRVAAVRAFYRFLVRTERIERDPTTSVRTPKQGKRAPRFLSADDAARLVTSPEGDGPVAARDRALLELTYGAGLRVSEVVGIDVVDVDVDAGTVRVTGKGSKTRVVPIGRHAAEAVRQWLRRRPELAGRGAHPTALFRNARGGGRISQRSVQRLVERCRPACSEMGATPHWLRHACASHMLGSGADLRSIQEQLGHARLGTTQRYTHVEIESLMRIYDQAHPRARDADD